VIVEINPSVVAGKLMLAESPSPRHKINFISGENFAFKS
jgi:hypothetical protein